MRRTLSLVTSRGTRIVAAVAMVVSVLLVDVALTGAVTGIPTFVVPDTTVERGTATPFTSVFTMDEGTAQATLNPPAGVTELTATYTSCTVTPEGAGQTARTCMVSAGGLVTVNIDGGLPAVENVTVTLVGAVAASANFPLTSEGAGPGTTSLPGVTLTLNQGASPQVSLATNLTVLANPATDIELTIATTAPAAVGATAGRGTSIPYTVMVSRSGSPGAIAQATTASAVLVANAAAGTTVTGNPQPLSWAANDTGAKPANFTVNVPANIALGGMPEYHIEVTYDPNSADAVAVTDTEVGAARAFRIVTGPDDATITVATTAPTEGQVVPRGTTVAYTGTLTRGGNTAQSTSAAVSLVVDGLALGTTVTAPGTPGTPLVVPFIPGQLSAPISITVDVPPGATIGNVAYHFVVEYDPTNTGGPILDTIQGAMRSFNVVAAQATLTLAPAGDTRSRGASFDLVATLVNPAGANPTGGNGDLKITVPVGMSIGVPTATAPAVADVVGQVVTATYPSIAAGETKVLTVPVTILASATKKAGADLAARADFDFSGPTTDLVDTSAFELTSDADVSITVAAPPTEQLDPDQVSVPVTYSVANNGPDPAASLSFVVTAPTGFVGAVNPVEGGDGPDSDSVQDWLCPDIAAGGTTTTCTYTGGSLNALTPTATVTINWVFDTVGMKSFVAAASTTTNDPTPGNNTNALAPAVTDISNPTSTVTIAAAASPDPVVVAVDKDAIITSVYTVRNNGTTKNIKAIITVPTPAGTFLQTLSATGGTCSVAAETAASSAPCSLGVLAKNGGTVTVTATYRVPQAAFTGTASPIFSASITPTNGVFDPASVTTASDSVVGAPPTIDIGLEAIVGNTVVNRPDGTVIPAGGSIGELRTFVFQNFSTQFPVRAGTAFVELTLPANVAIPGGCTGILPTVLCPIASVVPVATGIVPGIASVTLSIPLQTLLPVTITARAVVNDAVNRTVDLAAATLDSRPFSLDLNRTPSVTDDVGPGLPGGGTLTHFPLPLHDDDDADPITVTPVVNVCSVAGSCVETGGTITGLVVTALADRLTVTFTSVALTGAAAVTVKINYGVTDGKSVTTSTLLVKLLPAIVFDQPTGDRARLPGSFGRTPAGTAPRSFGVDISADRLGPTPTTIDVLEDGLGTDANDAAFPGGIGITYDLTTVSNDSLNVKGSTVDLAEASLERQVVRYVPSPGYTSDMGGIPSVKAPLDSFTYRASGITTLAGTPVTIFTVDGIVRAEIKNQNPIGVDDTFDVPNGVTQKFFPVVNDLDGNTVASPIAVKSPAAPPSFIFDDEGEIEVLRAPTIACIGPMPALDPVTKLPTADPIVLCPNGSAPTTGGFKRPAEALVLETADSKGKVTIQLTGLSTPPNGEDFRAINASADATVVGNLQFAYVVQDNYGGAGFGLATVRVPNTPPQVIDGVRTVLKNTPTVVVDTRLAAQDANGDTIVISGAPTKTENGTIVVTENRVITYTPNKDYLGPDKLLYSVSDGRADGAASAVLELNVVEQPGVLAAGGSKGTGGSTKGKLAATGANPLTLTGLGGVLLVLGLGLVQGGRRRQSRPVLDRARHLRS